MSPTLAEQALAHLRSEVISGALPAGSRIHLARTASRLGMSPIPVREALRTLASEGLVLSLPYRGFRVPQPTLDDLQDTYQLRLLLDPLAVKQAVPSMLQETLEKLETILMQFEDAMTTGDATAIRDANYHFHFTIYNSCHLPRLLRLVGIMWEASEIYQRLSASGRGTTNQRIDEHRRIYEACKQGDETRAAELMHTHLERTYMLAHKQLEQAE